jgi:prepilin-type N-terminal cleavage/methylation domain-containing protein
MKQKGFTIVELLIVIVVIGILAAITIVAYNGFQNRANDTAVQTDLRNFANIMAQQKAINGTHPATLTSAMGIKFNRSAYGLDDQSYTARYCLNAAIDDYIIFARSKSGNFFQYTSSGGLKAALAWSGWGVCQQIGLVNTNPSQNGLSGTTWDASWVN